MQYVLYTNQLEPITILELGYLDDFIKHNIMLRLPVVDDLTMSTAMQTPDVPPYATIRTVNIRVERFRYRNAESIILFTDDEKSALLLRAAFLPGQNKEVQARCRKAFIDGLFKGVMGGL